MGQHISPFLFEGEHMVRVLDESGDPLFAAKDVAAALSIVWKGDATLASIPERWKGVRSFGTPGGDQTIIFITEPAVYKLAFRSNKPEAERFTDWVASEVLPAIRKFGFYGAPNPDAAPTEGDANRPFPDWPLEEMRTKRGVVDMYRLTYGATSAQWVAPQLGFPVPPVDLVPGPQMNLPFPDGTEAP